ncbi:helix-turn-helix domain containing protein [Sphingobium sp. H39-3-25]|uniref:TetR family transcriptional regulator n=1 Tax=Sphingobium arseniciresistens TaxID=3030834 RepID=UPI0023B97E7F|nr:helix-turn-helix domain containing protein [Sphingobium arseniciresistens]
MRARFVDAAEAILSEVGEHGISARLIAQRAELKTQLLYYYFRTMDDLLRAVVQRVNERRLARFEEALAAPEPLRALWELMSDPSAAALAAELSSIANHREAVRDEIVSAAREFRILQTQAVEALLPAQAENDSPHGAAGVVMIAASLARMIVNETALGLTEGHAEALAIVEHMLARFRQDGAAQPATPPAT